MKVLIVGSKRHLAPPAEADQKRFEDACKQMGKLFAEKGHTLIVGTDDPLDADLFFVTGANEAPGRHTILVSRPEDDKRDTPYGGDPKKFENLDFRYSRRRGEWTASLVQALAEADVILVIGGRAAALGAGYSAETLKKPALAIPSFGGATQKIWMDVKKYYRDCGISEHDEAALQDTWSAGTAEVAVRSAERLVSKTPFRPKGRGAAIAMAASALTLIALWVALWNRMWGLGYDTALYPMMCVAALAGTNLSNVLRLIRNEITQPDARTILLEAAAGVLIGFGFVLLYLVTTYVVKGDIVPLEKETDFRRIAITMSVLGFTSALLVQESAATLQERLLNRLKEVGKTPGS